MNNSRSWDEDLAMGLVAMAATALVVTILVLLTELCRVFLVRAFAHTPTARILWSALACLALAWTSSALLLSTAATTSIGVYLAAWSFLAFVVVVEGCDWHQARLEQSLEPAELSVSDVLSPWQLGEGAPATTGTSDPVGLTLNPS